MKAIVFGYGNMGCEGIDALLRQGYEIPLIVTHEDDPNEKIWFRSVAELAAQHGIPVAAPKDPNHPLWVARIRALDPDFIFSFYYRTMLKPAVLDLAGRGGFNLHGSLLPRYRGRCPVNWALIHGESETGVTLHRMTPRPDDGPIVAQSAVPIAETDCARSLFDKLTEAARPLLDDALHRLADGTAVERPQDPAQSSYFGRRRPEDGEIDWSRSSTEVRNLVRAVTRPYPGAFSHVSGGKCLIWKVGEVDGGTEMTLPGTVLSLDPLTVACGRGALRIETGQSQGGVYMSGGQLAKELGLVQGMRLGEDKYKSRHRDRKREVLILGVNGFIGSALGERLLESGRYNVHGMDLRSDYLENLEGRDGFTFTEGDISIHREWLEYHVKKCDIVLPLVAIATPIEYTRNPLRVFELDFEENLRVVRYCAKYGKRLIFPSTSEVYGMCSEDEFDEDQSNLVLGPINKQRWIYSCCKQLLDRVIWAYGDKEGLDFTLFRPFNWVGPKLDRLSSARIGSSRAITQMILNLVEGAPIQLIDGGEQRRCFTDVTEGVECLYRIIDNRDGACDGRIFNIGNPDNECSIRELAEVLVDRFERHPLRNLFPPFAGYRELESQRYYGEGYQDVSHRKPSIRNARKLLGWDPSVDLSSSVERTLDFFLRQSVGADFREVRTG